MDKVGLSETRRPSSGDINRRDFTYNWSGMSNGARLKEVAIGISSIPVDERIMRLRLKPT